MFSSLETSRARVTAVVTSFLMLTSLFAGFAATVNPAPAQATTTPVLEFQRDAARASWVSGPGGNYFGVWQCPQGSLAVGVRGTESGGYVYNFGLICRYVDLATGTWGSYTYTATTHSGGSTELRCPDGRALVRVDVWTMSGYGYPIASETEPYCQFLDFGNVNATPRTIPVLTGSVDPAPTRYFGGRHGSLYGRATCGAGKFVVAIDGRRGALLDGLGIYCGGFTARAASVSNVTISGSTQFGVPITAAPTASGGPAPTMSYQWYRCDTADASTKTSIPAPPECELITGATSSSYSPQITDYGQHLRVAATATNYFGSATLVSATTPAPSVPPPTIDLPASDDSGSSNTDDHTNVKKPTFQLGRLVPTAVVTVTATKGAETQTCTFTAVASNPLTGAPTTGQCPMLDDLSDGTWTITASQTFTPQDQDGNPLTPITSSNGSMSLVVDSTPAVLANINLKNGSTVIGNGDANAASAANTFTLTYPSATDAYPGVTITCSIDGGPYVPCPSSYRDLSAGSHSLTVRAVDKAGNESTKVHNWFVVVPPVVALDPASDSGYSNTDANTNDNTPRIRVSKLVVGAVVTITATRSGQTSRTCTFTATATIDTCDDWKITTGGVTSDADLSDGTWNYSATQRYVPNGSGSAATSTVSNYLNVIIDTVAPTFTRWYGEAFTTSGNLAAIYIDGGIVRGNLTWMYRVSPQWADTYLWHGTCSFDGGSQTAIASTGTTAAGCQQTRLPSGTHTMVYTRTDVAGNQATPQTFRWTVVNTPLLGLDASSDTGSSNSDRITSDNTPTMTVNDVAPGATVTVTATRSGFPTVTCTFTAPAAVAPATSSSGSCDLPQMQDASNWSVSSTQSLNGNTQTSNTVTLNIDTTRPIPTMPTIRAGTSNGAVIANESVTTQTTAWIGAVTAVTGETRQCKLDGTVVPCPTTNTAFTNLSTGLHTFEVIATDAAGNVGISSTTWRVLGKPVVSLDSSSDTGSSDSDRITRDTTPQINVSGLSGGGGIVTVTATKAGSAAVTCTFVATSTSGGCDLPDMVDGTWSVTAVESVRVGASTVNSVSADPVTVTIDTVTPTKPTTAIAVNGISVTPGSVIQLGAGVTTGALTFPSLPTSEVGATLLCSLNGASAVPCPSSGFANVPNGMNSLTVIARDAAGNESSTTVQWAQVPEITLGLDPSTSLKTDSSGQAFSSSRNQSVSATGFVGRTEVTVTATKGAETVTCTYTPDADGNGGCPLTFSEDGEWTITATNGTSSQNLSPLIVDTTAPVLTSSIKDSLNALVAGTAGSTTGFKTSQSTLNVTTGTTDLTATTVTCALDGAPAGPCPATLTNLTYGVHTLVVQATDSAGNISTDTLTWQVTAPPTVTLTTASDTGKSQSDGITKDTSPTIRIGNLGQDVDVVVTATKGTETVKCYLWHANETGSVPGSADCTFGTMVDGSWTITATQSISGRPEWISPASAATTVVIDSVSPTTPTATFTNSIAAGILTTQTSIGFVSGPTSSDPLAIEYTCSLNGGTASSCSSYTGLSAGSHRLVYTATDLAGNASTGTLSWTVIGPPTVNLKATSDTGDSNSDRITNDSSPQIEVSNLIPGASVVVTATKGLETVTCQFVAGAPTIPTSASSTGECELPGLTSDGSWTFTAVQSMGGTQSTASTPSSFTLDTLAPGFGTPTNVTIDGAVVSVLANPDITAIAAGDPVVTGSGTESTSITLTLPAKEASATRSCSLDGVVHDCNALSLTNLATGLHTFSITDKDPAGNVTTQSFVWSVVGVPTVALATSSDSGAADRITNVETPEFTAGALIEGATVQIVAVKDGVSRSCSFVAVDGVTSCELPPLGDGQWSVTSRQGFGTGWSNPSVATTVTVDTTAPADISISLTAGGSSLVFTADDEIGAASSEVTLGAPSSTDAHSRTYTCSLNGLRATSCPASYSALGSGVNTLVVTATDIAGNTSTLTRHWSVIGAPVVSLASDSDTGALGDGITSEARPFFDVSNLMPGATVTVTATRNGTSQVLCSFVAPTVAAPTQSSSGSCLLELGVVIAGPDWVITAAQSYTTTTFDSSDRVTLNSAVSVPFNLDVVQPHDVAINAPVQVSIAEGTLLMETRSIQLEEVRQVVLTSLSPSVCSIDANGNVVLLTAGTCTLRGNAAGGDVSGVYYDEGVRTVSFTVLPVQTVSTVPAATIIAANPGLNYTIPAATGGSRPQRPQNVGTGGENGAPATTGLKPPPPTTSMQIERITGRDRARVVATVRQDVPGAPVRSVVFVIFNEDGLMLRQVAVEVERDQTVVEAVVPYASDEYQIRTYTTNEAGISNKAPIGANVLNQPTTLGKRKDGTPILFGKEIAKPVLFDPDSPELTPKATKVLDGVVRYAKKSGGRVFITGFVRNQGGSVKDQKALSDARAEQVAMYLSKRGVAIWIRYNGYGAYRKGQGLPNDRRVEVRWSADEIPSLEATKANLVFFSEQAGS